MKHIKWSEIPAERLNDQFVRKIAWDGKLMIALTEVDKGYVVPLHSHVLATAPLSVQKRLSFPA